MLSDQNPELAPTYYLANYRLLITQVRQLYADLLNIDERAFCDDFLTLSADAQCLFVRLINRKGDWFRSDKLAYKEISDTVHAIRELEKMHFISCHTVASLLDEYSICYRALDQALDTESCGDLNELYTQLADCLSLYTKSELLRFFCDHPLKSLSKLDLVTEVAARLITSSAARERMPSDDLICVYGEQELDVYRLLYFGNLHQDLTEFVLRDLGVYTYENYVIGHQSRWCHEREQLERHNRFYILRHEIGELNTLNLESLNRYAKTLVEFIQECELKNDCLLIRRLQHLHIEVARQLERLKDIDSALQWYRYAKYHPARERRLRILISAGRVSEAEILAEEMLAAPWREEERQFLASFIPRKFTNANLVAKAQQHQEKISIEVLELPVDINRLELGVERAAAQALLRSFNDDIILYCENLLIPSVFGLFFWEVLYTEVPGAFFHPFQVRPSDLYDEDFLLKRATILEKAWEDLSTPELFCNRVLGVFRDKKGVVNPFVHWDFLTSELLELALKRIPLGDWNMYFRFIWRDVRHHKTGLPDLIRFSSDGSYELIEIKGPGDSLQKNQKVWFNELAKQGISARVLQVKDHSSGSV